ncbi:citrate synthase [candidate division MSBL1 archaeon SCGC-AAA382M17]|uniref:Citrate synthase n=1 Tax=candidate division MSBL1 archaeon SCGC-AAA382M17 TaxID=1698284 RepID=A0ABR5TK38_9EURY|nr:citrate synthase [candidate division MSBL1 archaeon SCGC-AAA382M17]
MVKRGMRDVVVLESDISRIDGKKGELEYRGYSIHDLAENSSYEEIAFLLLRGHLPTQEELEEFERDLARRRNIAPEVIGLLSSLPDITHPMVVLRTAISYTGSMDEKLHVIEPEENLEKSKEILAMIPTIIAYAYRMRHGKQLVHPREDLGHAANFLYMLKGEEPTALEEKALDTDLILHAEHTLNASTFASRMAASTKSDMYAGIVSATGTLMGPLHGGASQAVIEMLKEIKESGEKPEEWIRRKLEAGELIPGFGHRVYETMDPRAKELKKLAWRLDKESESNLCSISERVEEFMIEEKGLYPNVDFYTATVYEDLGIPDDLFIPIFAMGRVAGWTAHLMDQYAENVLIRPKQDYVGEKEREYVLIEEREA